LSHVAIAQWNAGFSAILPASHSPMIDVTIQNFEAEVIAASMPPPCWSTSGRPGAAPARRWGRSWKSWRPSTRAASSWSRSTPTRSSSWPPPSGSAASRPASCCKGGPAGGRLHGRAARGPIARVPRQARARRGRAGRRGRGEEAEATAGVRRHRGRAGEAGRCAGANPGNDDIARRLRAPADRHRRLRGSRRHAGRTPAREPRSAALRRPAPLARRHGVRRQKRRARRLGHRAVRRAASPRTSATSTPASPRPRC
jgi:hypothetical protein